MRHPGGGLAQLSSPPVTGLEAPPAISRVIIAAMLCLIAAPAPAQVALVRVQSTEDVTARETQWAPCGPQGCPPQRMMSPRCGPQGCPLQPIPEDGPVPGPAPQREVVTLAKGSCVCIGRDGTTTWFLTCGHLCRGREPHIEVAICGRWQRAVLVSRSDDPDLALLAVETDCPADIFRLGPAPPAQGTAVEIIGFPAGGPHRRRAAAVVAHGPGLLWMSIPAEPGESGGAVLRGEVCVGIVAGTATDGSRWSCAVDCAAVSAWLNARRPRVPDCAVPLPPSELRGSVGPRGPAGPPGPPADPAELLRLSSELTSLRWELTSLRAELVALHSRPLPSGECADSEARDRLAQIESRLRTLATPIRLWDLQTGKLLSHGTARIYAGEPIDIRLGGATVVRPRNSGD